MMKRNEIEIVKAKKGSHEDYRCAGDQPGTFGNRTCCRRLERRE
jgi:hypothetical protein